MSAPHPAEEKSLRSRLFLPTLLLAEFLLVTFTVFVANDLVDIAKTFKVSVGTGSQILTVSNFVALIVGIVVGFLAVRFKHKSLFLSGVALYAVGALGCFYAPNFASMLFFNIFLGGGSMTGIMVLAMIGDFFPLQKRGIAVGLAIAASAGAAQLIMPQVTSLITDAMGWRAVLSWFIFPLSLVTLLFGFFVLPSKPQQEQNYKQAKNCDGFQTNLD